MVERYEDDITHWYYKLINTNLTHWLCVEKSVLKPSEIGGYGSQLVLDIESEFLMQFLF